MTNISEHGFWLLHDGKEYFLDYAHFPWFKKATVEQITNVQLHHGSHLHWPALDVDLSFKIIQNPETYGLISR